VAKPTPHRDKWRIRWLDEHGKRQSAVFDEYKAAQKDLSRRLVEVEEVRRGIRNATPPEKTFGDLCDYWIEHRAPRKRSCKDDESIIRRHLRPAFGTMKVRDVGVEEVDGYVNGKIDEEELSDKTVSNHVTLLATMLRLATTFKVPWLLQVPRFRKPKVSLFSRDFQWLRTDDEIGRFLRAARGEDVRAGRLRRHARRGAGGARVVGRGLRAAPHHRAAELRRSDQVGSRAVRADPRPPSPGAQGLEAPAARSARLHQPGRGDVRAVGAHLSGGAASGAGGR
jgi:hypothetical protein